MLPITVLSGWARLALLQLIQALLVAVRSARTTHPVQGCSLGTVVPYRTNLRLAGDGAVVTSGAKVAYYRVRVVHLKQEKHREKKVGEMRGYKHREKAQVATNTD